MTMKCHCDNCDRICESGYISLVENSIFQVCHIESINYQVCSIDCAIALLEKQKKSRGI